MRYKYGRPKKRVIDQKKINIYLTKIAFEVQKIRQEWRHLLAFGKFLGKDAVFKLASTQTTATCTQNEYNWNDVVNKVREQHLNLTVPKNYSSGHYEKLFYFIAEEFKGEPLIKKNSKNTNRISRRIKQIAKVTREIQTLKFPSGCAFSKRKKSKEEVPIGQRLLSSTTEWASRVPRNLDRFIKAIDSVKDKIRTCSGHGDFVARQMYQVRGKIGIIDGEHAGAYGALHYDVAQFYLRLRNDHDAKELAQQYLVEFKSLLPRSYQNIFWEELKPVLIQRYIGDLWGAAKDANKLDELEALGKEIIENRLLKR